VLGCGVRTVSTPRLDREVVDVLWVATKAMRLDPAVMLAPPDRVRAAIVITLRNGVDHVALLPKRYPDVVRASSASS
jgi:ketopantoate reductase